MPTKKGAGGRQQNYDPRTGRFSKNDYLNLAQAKLQPSKKEKAKQKEQKRRENLFNRAQNSKDKYLFELFCAIEEELPGCVQFVNENRFDPSINRWREFDIITKKCIIEVKSGLVSRCLAQFQAQKRYADIKGKTYAVFAPDIFYNTKSDYLKNGIKVFASRRDLISFIKEYEQ